MNAENTNILNTVVAKAGNLEDLVDYCTDAIVSKTILDKPVGTITVFAFDKGQKLSEHTSPYDAVVQVVKGRARLTIGETQVDVSQGELIIMPANVPHAVNADEKFKMLLTMIRK